MLHVFADYDLSSVLTTYTRIKVLLAEEAANSPWSGLAEISPFSCLTDYYIVGGNHSDFPEVMRLEAKLAEGITVAKHALKILWDVAVQLDSFGLTRRRTMKRPGEDAVIVRHLIKAITDMEDGYNLGSMHCTIQGPSTTAKASSRPIASGGECHSIHSIHQEMAGLLSRAGENLKVQGSERFFGEESPAWFVKAAFRAAYKAQDAKDSVAAAALFRASACFYIACPSPSPEYLAEMRNAYMLAIRASLDAHSHDASRKPYLSLA
ncbi:g2236 [Coccomyxa viridis]|uniref:G2236 protein n=1 Tax=Coccomyxa viridis TaxID=1274662 RepID=A0ABP1FLI7_9CHLO